MCLTNTTCCFFTLFSHLISVLHYMALFFLLERNVYIKAQSFILVITITTTLYAKVDFV